MFFSTTRVNKKGGYMIRIQIACLPPFAPLGCPTKLGSKVMISGLVGELSRYHLLTIGYIIPIFAHFISR